MYRWVRTNEDAARISNHKRLSAVLTFVSPENDF
jgi:hypothetical protein